MSIAYLALGSNLGGRHAFLAAALARLSALPATRLAARGGVYETAPVGPQDQGAFLNTVVALDTRLTPRQLLAAGQAIETALGRLPENRRLRWGPREMDVDLLAFGDCVVDLPDLQLPHARMAGRWFVLKPLADIAPGWVPPGWRQTVAEALAQLEQTDPSCRGTLHVA